jgi:hypothetical protein
MRGKARAQRAAKRARNAQRSECAMRGKARAQRAAQ